MSKVTLEQTVDALRRHLRSPLSVATAMHRWDGPAHLWYATFRELPGVTKLDREEGAGTQASRTRSWSCDHRPDQSWATLPEMLAALDPSWTVVAGDAATPSGDETEGDPSEATDETRAQSEEDAAPAIESPPVRPSAKKAAVEAETRQGDLFALFG